MVDIIQFYRQYGESLAARLTAIDHKPGQTRFVYVEEEASAEEVIAAATRELKPETNVLIWERFTERLTDGRRDNYNTQILGSLAVMRKPTKTSREARTSAIDECRDVALKVMGLMRFDEQDQGGRLCQNSIHTVVDGQAGEPIPMVAGGWVGYGFSFDWLVPLDFGVYEDDVQDDAWLWLPL